MSASPSLIAAFQAKVLGGELLSHEEAFSLWVYSGESGARLAELCAAADKIRRHYCGNAFDLCTIVNGKSGRCGEDCKYCAQSAHFATPLSTHGLLSGEEIVREAERQYGRGILRFSVVTSGRKLPDDELDALCSVYRALRSRCPVALCASHGLLSLDALRALKEAGVERYHCNLETSRRYFPSVCTTHAYEEKMATIRNAREAGLAMCSGGIFGMGETVADRIDLALALRELEVKSVPINILNPIPGTPFEKMTRISPEEAVRSVALFRFLLPDAALRLAGGRGLLPDGGADVFRAGANAAITGDMLTTAGVDVESDRAMLASLGFEVRRI